MAIKKNSHPSAIKEAPAVMAASGDSSGARPSLLPGSKQNRRILLARAALLAKKRDDEQTGSKHESYLLFRLGQSELFGIQWSSLVEVLPGRHLTTVPGTPACVVGVFNRRGKILCALDIAGLIGLPDSHREGMNEMIVVQAAGMMVGIVVNELLGSQSYDPVRLEAPLAARKNGARGAYVHGIDQGKITLLDLENLLQHPALSMSETTIQMKQFNGEVLK